MSKRIKVGNIHVGGKGGLFFISGPCVIESPALCFKLADRLKSISKDLGVPYIFKASYDKANRTSVKGFRGPGLKKGLDILAEVKARYNVPLLTDVHTPAEAEAAAKVVDVIQIPAFLCRQTDLVTACGNTGAVVNIKKGQFLGPEDMEHVVRKVEATGNKRILLTERGNSFGYGNLVADMRNLVIMQQWGYPVVFDATHSVQRPGSNKEGFTPGDGHLAPTLAKAAVAAGCDGLFMETHPNPSKAKSDAQNALPLRKIRGLWETLNKVHDAVTT